MLVKRDGEETDRNDSESMATRTSQWPTQRLLGEKKERLFEGMVSGRVSLRLRMRSGCLEL